MTWRIVCTERWTLDELAPYGRDITAAMKKLAARFPNDITLKGLARDVITGKRTLWLIIDEEDRFGSFVLTETIVNEDTGHKSVIVTSLAGEEGPNVTDLIADVEKWAWERGADETSVFGRLGWKRSLAAQGYAPGMMLFRKPRP